MSVMHDQRGRIAVDATMRSRSHPNVWALGSRRSCICVSGGFFRSRSRTR
jgi:hypothetical protein